GFIGEWVELFEAKDSNVFSPEPVALALQVEIDFPAAHQDPRCFSAGALRVRKDTFKAAEGEVAQARNNARISQQAFRRHHDERLAPSPQYLPAQTVKELCRCGWLNNLYVVLGGQNEEPLEARAGMFRPLTFHAMGEKQRDAAQTAPFNFGRSD